MTDKAENEIWLAGKFAEAHNREHQTDFVAESASAERDSADAYLTSRASGKRVALQICMATTQERMREESIQDQLQRRISATLMAKGLSNCLILIVPRSTPVKADAGPWHDSIFSLVLEHYAKATPSFELSDDGESSPLEGLPFSSITIHRGSLPEKWQSWAIVNFIVVKDVLEVNPTIQGAIDKKVAKNYSDSADLWLLLHPGDGAHSVEQVELLALDLKNLERFAQVWWVYPQRGADTGIHRFTQTSR